MKKYLGIDIGGTSIKYGLYNGDGQSLNKDGEVPSVRDDFDKILSILTEIVNKFPDVDGIGVSVPGGVDKRTRVMFDGGACVALTGKDLRSVMQEKFKIPVEIENDANCAALAELWKGNGRGCENFVCITVGTGIGGGIVIDGKLYAGANSFAGEFGYMMMNLHGERMDLHGTASTSMTIQKLSEQTGLDIKDGRTFFASMDKPEVKEAYDNWVRELAIGIHNIALGLDPEKVLLGGGVSAQPGFIEDLNKALNELKIYDFKWFVEQCYFKNDAGKVGAVYKLISTK